MKADQVFYKLRVSTPTPCPPTSDKTTTSPRPSSSGRTHHNRCHQQDKRQQQRTIIFNGISANSWLFPIGIRHKDTWTEKKRGAPGAEGGPKGRLAQLNSAWLHHSEANGEPKSRCKSARLPGERLGRPTQCPCERQSDSPETNFKERPKSVCCAHRPGRKDGACYDGRDWHINGRSSEGRSENSYRTDPLGEADRCNDREKRVKSEINAVTKLEKEKDAAEHSDESKNRVLKTAEDCSEKNDKCEPVLQKHADRRENESLKDNVHEDGDKDSVDHPHDSSKKPDSKDHQGQNVEGSTLSEGIDSSVKKCPPITSEEFDSIWERVAQRPATAGKVFIIRRQKPPLGLDTDECLQGKSLHTKTRENEELMSTEGEEVVQLQPRPFTAPRMRRVRFGSSGEGQASCSARTRQRPCSHTGTRRGEFGIYVDGANVHHPPSIPSSFHASEDLVVTSLSLSKPNPDQSSCSNNAGDSQNDLKTIQDPPRPKTASSASTPRPKTASSALTRSKSKQRQHDEDSFDTIESLKRSFLRRAKSAPPGKARFSTSLADSWSDTATNSDKGKPSLYWKARSGYHRKLMAYLSEDDDQDVQQTNTAGQSMPGSLWRPLMMNEGEVYGPMQHSAGCPYKCKGCFKACLVSEDYLEKARTKKLLKEKEEQTKHPPTGSSQTFRLRSYSRSPVVTRHKAKIKDPQNIVSIALAKSQPLYQLVHGKTKEKPDPSASKLCGAGDSEK